MFICIYINYKNQCPNYFRQNLVKISKFCHAQVFGTRIFFFNQPDSCEKVTTLTEKQFFFTVVYTVFLNCNNKVNSAK